MSFSTSHAVESSSSYLPQSCRQFTFSEIELATQKFDESLVIGCGGFGKVYRGTINYGEIRLDAAIKRLKPGSNQGAVEFWAEIEMLSNLRHCHLVSLIGYCSDRKEMILVYEYMPRGTLADHLHKRRAPLTWVRRLKICIGAARGLDYLHTGTGIMHGVIHRDVKSTNILLDGNWAAKISDFGLSKIGPTNQPCTYVSTLVKGTFGYLDPDYFQTGRLTRKSDVYAFGVVLLEVLCGKQAVDRSIDEEEWGLATWAQDSIKDGRLKEIVDSTLKGRISPKCLKEFALLAGRCLHSRPKQRPTMAEVVVGLDSILVLQEKTKSTLLIKLFGRRVPASIFPLQPENLELAAGGTSLKSLDLYLYASGGEDRIVHRFDFNIIVYATENFSDANKISFHGYKSMYKGRLQNGQYVTIAETSSDKECMNEASILVKFEHENVIQLLGYCIHGRKMYLLYDFAANATLAGLIFDHTCSFLDWNKRYQIILGVARGLAYLHNHSPIRIIHCDVNPANILLDESFDPKLSCFGVAMAIDHDETDGFKADRVSRTLNPLHPTKESLLESANISQGGYIAPEYLSRNWMSTKADVFSFGVLVLQIVTGERTLDLDCLTDQMLSDNVRRNWLEETLSDIIDPRIDADSILMAKFIEMGLLCVQSDDVVRPTMKEVVDMLLGTLSRTLLVSKMLARMKPELVDSDLDLDGNDSHTGEVEEFLSELSLR